MDNKVSYPEVQNLSNPIKHYKLHKMWSMIFVMLKVLLLIGINQWDFGLGKVLLLIGVQTTD